jgi:hypothetical protein
MSTSYQFFSYFFAATLEHRADFSVSWSFYRRQDSLDGWSARRKASIWTQDNTNIHALCGFELTIPASERAKTVHVSDRSATVTGLHTTNDRKNIIQMKMYLSDDLNLKGYGYTFILNYKSTSYNFPKGRHFYVLYSQ